MKLLHCCLLGHRTADSGEGETILCSLVSPTSSLACSAGFGSQVSFRSAALPPRFFLKNGEGRQKNNVAMNVWSQWQYMHLLSKSEQMFPTSHPKYSEVEELSMLLSSRGPLTGIFCPGDVKTNGSQLAGIPEKRSSFNSRFLPTLFRLDKVKENKLEFLLSGLQFPRAWLRQEVLLFHAVWKGIWRNM